jgi:flagellar protein FliT
VLDRVTKNNRQESIELIEKLLNNRETVLRSLDKNILKNNPLVKQLLLDEDVIRKKMDSVLKDIQADIQDVSKKRSLGENYINPYKNLRINGAFFDKKK